VETVPADAADVRFVWTPGPSGTAQNNGETVQANLAEGGHIMIGDTRYDLVQYHFHSPAEHAVDGTRQEAEVHFVHRATSGALAVVGVTLTGGGTSGAFDALLAAAPLEEGEAPLGPTEPASFLPQDRSYFRYAGSLTTPPCTEIVLWTVMQSSSAVSDAAIATFRSRFAPNARPLQQVNRRFILRE
jgi:carbonic anhydrase